MDEKYPRITLSELNYTHIQEFLNDRLRQGVKGNSVKQYYLTLHSNFTITANLYSHLEYNAKIISAETIARVLDSDKDSEEQKNDTPSDTGEPSASK